MVQLLEAGSPAGVQGALRALAQNAETAVTIAAAGAIPALEKLIGSGSPNRVKLLASQALVALGAAAEAGIFVMEEEMQGLGLSS
jgi:hypothetical protein